jgi:hypothetical protein
VRCVHRLRAALSSGLSSLAYELGPGRPGLYLSLSSSRGPSPIFLGLRLPASWKTQPSALSARARMSDLASSPDAYERPCQQPSRLRTTRPDAYERPTARPLGKPRPAANAGVVENPGGFGSRAGAGVVESPAGSRSLDSQFKEAHSKAEVLAQVN